MFTQTKKLSIAISRFYQTHFTSQDLNMTLINVLSHESTSNKLTKIFQKFEEFSGKKTMASIIEDEENLESPQGELKKKGYLNENVRKI